jgi:hypothetical protein
LFVNQERPFGPHSIVWRFLGLAFTLFFVESISLLPYYISSSITGSDVLETRTLELSGFDRIRLDSIARQGSRFETDITCGKPYAVTVTMDDNIYRYLDIRLEGETLVVGLQSPALYQSISMVLNINLPRLISLDMCGCYAILHGSNPSENLDIFMNEGSQLWVDHLQTRALGVTLLNYSLLFGGFVSNTAVFDMSGGSNAWLWNGNCDTLKATLSGAGVAINELVAQDLDIVLREDSKASINVTNKLKAVLQGRAVFQYYGNPVTVNILSNPSATIHQESGLPPTP